MIKWNYNFSLIVGLETREKKTLFKRDLVVALAYAHMQQKTFPLEKPS